MKWDVANLKMYLETLEPILKLVTSLTLKHCSQNTKIDNYQQKKRLFHNIACVATPSTS